MLVECHRRSEQSCDKDHWAVGLRCEHVSRADGTKSVAHMQDVGHDGGMVELFGSCHSSDQLKLLHDRSWFRGEEGGISLKKPLFEISGPKITTVRAPGGGGGSSDLAIALLGSDEPQCLIRGHIECRCDLFVSCCPYQATTP